MKRILHNYFDDPASYEQKAREQNLMVMGVDEAGRGCLAGPVVAAAILLTSQKKHPLLRDSKTLSAQQRDTVYTWLTLNSIFSVGIINNRIIDTINIHQASIRAMERAVIQLIYTTGHPDLIIVDAMNITITSGNGTIVAFNHAEEHSPSVAAASIVAKVTRDRLVETLHQSFPKYHLHNHKGYGTQKHQIALKTHGKSILHRLSFKGV
jgi:ribonuclease HII